MKIRAAAFSLAVLLLSAVLLASLMSVDVVSASTTSQISITGDTELASQATAMGWPGDGTASNPYIISGITVSNPLNGLGIFVTGTSKYLIIENCTISGTTSYAVDITGSSHVTIRDSAISGCFCAVVMYTSNNCTVTNNTISSCQSGILLMSSYDIMIAGNTITDSLYDGIELFTSSRNTITGNVVSGSGDYGLYLSSSDGNTIYGNTFIDNNGAGTNYNTEHAQAYDLGVNTWTYGGEGNEWSDWSSEGAYPHEGSAAANDVLNTLDIGDMLPIILAIVVVVVAIVVAFVLLRRKGQGAQRTSAPPASPPPEQAASTVPQPKGPVPKIKPWVPAVILGVVAVVAILVVTSSMGWLPLGSSKLSGARDIGGEWEGTGSIWSYNIYGDKAVLIEATFHLDIDLDGNHVTGVMDIYPTSQTPIADLYVLEPENHLSIDGTYEVTTLTFETYHTAFEFEFLTDMATGQVNNTDDYAYLGLGSDHGAIHLTRA